MLRISILKKLYYRLQYTEPTQPHRHPNGILYINRKKFVKFM